MITSIKAISTGILLLIATNCYSQKKGVYTSLENALKHKDKVKVLDLSTDLDPEYIDIQRVSNPLHVFPDEILELTNIESIILDHNLIDSLPKSINQLKKLRHLSLSGNNLRYIEPGFGPEHLNIIDLSNNQLTELPESIGSMVNLQVLGLKWNKLQALPSSIGKLTALKELNVSGNELNTIPQSIGDLKLLESLELSSNKIDTLFYSFGELEGLTTLDLSYNELEYFPTEITQLSGLSYLSLENNLLSHKTQIPESFGNLSSLEYLDLGSNLFSYLPNSIYKLAKLKQFHLEHCYNLRLLPTSMNQLEELELLDIRHCGNINTLISVVKTMKKLSRLYIGYTEISRQEELQIKKALPRCEIHNWRSIWDK